MGERCDGKGYTRWQQEENRLSFRAGYFTCACVLSGNLVAGPKSAATLCNTSHFPVLEDILKWQLRFSHIGRWTRQIVLMCTETPVELCGWVESTVCIRV